MIIDDELLAKYNGIWEKVNKSIKKEFDSEPISNETYLKTKEKSYKGKINTYLHSKIPKGDFEFICFPVILIDSVFRAYDWEHKTFFWFL